jgi:hypothetical protein
LWHSLDLPHHAGEEWEKVAELAVLQDQVKQVQLFNALRPALFGGVNYGEACLHLPQPQATSSHAGA